MILLMVQKSQTTTFWMYKNLVNNGENYQPQLVQDFFHQQYDIGQKRTKPRNRLFVGKARLWYEGHHLERGPGVVVKTHHQPFLKKNDHLQDGALSSRRASWWYMGVEPKIGVFLTPPNHPMFNRGLEPLFSSSILGVFPLFFGSTPRTWPWHSMTLWLVVNGTNQLWEKSPLNLGGPPNIPMMMMSSFG